MRARSLAAAAACAVLATACGSDQAADGDDADGGDMVLATTTSTQNSGLLDEILPDFEDSSGCTIKPVAVGSGQAMRMGERGEADAVLAHSPDAEEQFMADGHGTRRDAVMHNDFVLVGPPDDPAGVSNASVDTAAAAMALIDESDATFASRADDSGTHSKELALWEEAGIEPSGESYVETGQGMGETLTIANQQEAYTLSDRGTFLATSGLDSEIAFDGTDDLRNDYHVIVVDDENVNVDCANDFADWITDSDTQQAIGEFGVDEYGEALFFPDAE